MFFFTLFSVLVIVINLIISFFTLFSAGEIPQPVHTAGRLSIPLYRRQLSRGSAAQRPQNTAEFRGRTAGKNLLRRGRVVRNPQRGGSWCHLADGHRVRFAHFVAFLNTPGG